MANEKAIDQSRVSDCKFCGHKLVWLKSPRTGKLYPVEYDGTRDNMGYAVVETNKFHNCPMRQKPCSTPKKDVEQ